MGQVFCLPTDSNGELGTRHLDRTFLGNIASQLVRSLIGRQSHVKSCDQLRWSAVKFALVQPVSTINTFAVEVRLCRDSLTKMLPPAAWERYRGLSDPATL